LKNLKIYLILVGTMVVWGVNVPVLKIIVERFMPITATSIRIFIAGITVFVILSWFKLVRKPTKKEVIYIVLGSLLSVVFHHSFLAMGLTKTTAVNGGLILGLGPLLTAILASVLLKEIPSFIRVIGFLLGSLGVFITVLAGGNGLSGGSVGDLYVFLAITSQALSFILISKAAKTLDPRLLTGYMLIIGAIILFIISLIKEPGGLQSLSKVEGSSWAWLLASGIFATALGHMIYNFAIGRIGAADASIFMNLNIFFALLGSALLLGEQIKAAHLFGVVFIVAGVILGSGTYEILMLRRIERRKRKDVSPL
jgi:drug/metabolite transporter (DMT)-like permease